MSTGQAPTICLLDTNLVELTWRFGIGDEGFDLLEHIAPLYRAGHNRLALDLLALEDLFGAARHAGLVFRVAPATIRELARSPEFDGREILNWGWELADYQAPHDWPQEESSLRTAGYFLRHRVSGTDAVLLGEMIRLGCHALLTCDYRRLRRRERLRGLGHLVLRPAEISDWINGCGHPPWAHSARCSEQKVRSRLLSSTGSLA